MEVLYETHHSDRGLDRRRGPRERAIPHAKPGAGADLAQASAGAGADIEEFDDAPDY